MPSIPPEGATEADLLEYIEEMVEYRNDYRDYERELDNYKKALSDSATEAYLGALFIMNANRTHYEGVIEDLHNEILVGRVKWPINLHAAYRQLEGFRKQERKGNNNQRRKGNDGNRQSDGGSQVSFVQSDATTGTDGRLFAFITCNKCGDKGRYADRCPSQVQLMKSYASVVASSPPPVQLLQSDPSFGPMSDNDKEGLGHLMFSQLRTLISKWWFVLDSGSTVNSFQKS
jgi:hypothetical protein